MRKKFLFFISGFLTLFYVEALRAEDVTPPASIPANAPTDESVVVASKHYADSIASVLESKEITNVDLSRDGNILKLGAVNKRGDRLQGQIELSAVAFSGSYNDLIDKPTSVEPGHEYVVETVSKTGAVTGDSFYIDIDGLRFRTFKSSQNPNYWGTRVANNTDAPIEYSVRAQHYYTGTQVLSQSGTINVGAEMNPDTEATDIGYSVHDTFHTFFTDWTNMHYYRWIVSVNGSSAIMTVERLY